LRLRPEGVVWLIVARFSLHSGRDFAIVWIQS
jgi:hypothetical protein